MELDTETFEDLILSEKRTALVDFWAPWCSHCRRLALTYDAVAAQRKQQLLVAKVNIDDEPFLARGYKIDVVPTLLLFQGGNAVAALIAPDSKQEIDAFLNKWLQI